MSARIYWENSKEPWFIQTENVAYSGKVAVVKTAVVGNEGRPMKLKYITATAANINTWLNLVGAPFAASTFRNDLPGNVIFSRNNPLTYTNMMLKDGNYDISQAIFTVGNPTYKAGFDYWMGSINLIMVT